MDATDFMMIFITIINYLQVSVSEFMTELIVIAIVITNPSTE